jgi:hypothetical protein
VPLYCSFIIRNNTSTLRIHHTQRGLSTGMTLLCKRRPLKQCCFKVSAL